MQQEVPRRCRTAVDLRRIERTQGMVPWEKSTRQASATARAVVVRPVPSPAPAGYFLIRSDAANRHPGALLSATASTVLLRCEVVLDR